MRRLSTLLGALLLAACGAKANVGSGSGTGGGGTGGAVAAAGQWVWRSDVPSSQQLNAVWASGPADVWAAGDDGVMLHFDGAAWVTVNPGTMNHLHAIWGASPDDVWAVGGGVGGPDTANLVHWDGQAWAPVDSGTALNLSGVWGSGASDVYAAGGDSVTGTIQRFDGTSWKAVWSSVTTAPAAVWGSGASDVWAVGAPIYPSFGDYYVVRDTGGGFVSVPSGVTQYLSSVWSAAPDDAWAQGLGGLLHWNGQAWSAVSSALPAGAGGVWGLGAQRVFRVAGDQTVAAWDGTAWSAAHADPVGAGLTAVGGSDPSHLWAVGANATILAFETSLSGAPACGDVRGQCGPGSACAVGQGHPSDYACGGSDVCCVAETACGGAEAACCNGGVPGPRPICHNGAFVCPAPSGPCPMHP